MFSNSTNPLINAAKTTATAITYSSSSSSSFAKTSLSTQPVRSSLKRKTPDNDSEGEYEEVAAPPVAMEDEDDGGEYEKIAVQKTEPAAEKRLTRKEEITREVNRALNKYIEKNTGNNELVTSVKDELKELRKVAGHRLRSIEKNPATNDPKKISRTKRLNYENFENSLQKFEFKFNPKIGRGGPDFKQLLDSINAFIATARFWWHRGRGPRDAKGILKRLSSTEIEQKITQPLTQHLTSLPKVELQAVQYSLVMLGAAAMRGNGYVGNIRLTDHSAPNSVMKFLAQVAMQDAVDVSFTENPEWHCKDTFKGRVYVEPFEEAWLPILYNTNCFGKKIKDIKGYQSAVEIYRDDIKMPELETKAVALFNRVQDRLRTPSQSENLARVKESAQRYLFAVASGHNPQFFLETYSNVDNLKKFLQGTLGVKVDSVNFKRASENDIELNEHCDLTVYRQHKDNQGVQNEGVVGFLPPSTFLMYQVLLMMVVGINSSLDNIVATVNTMEALANADPDNTYAGAKLDPADKAAKLAMLIRVAKAAEAKASLAKDVVAKIAAVDNKNSQKDDQHIAAIKLSKVEAKTTPPPSSTAVRHGFKFSSELKTILRNPVTTSASASVAKTADNKLLHIPKKKVSGSGPVLKKLRLDDSKVTKAPALPATTHSHSSHVPHRR